MDLHDASTGMLVYKSAGSALAEIVEVGEDNVSIRFCYTTGGNQVGQTELVPAIGGQVALIACRAKRTTP